MIVDGFSGGGGWQEGLKLLGLSSLGVEIDPVMCATSRAAGHQVVQADVAAIDPRTLVPEGERCEGVIMSPPCPSFSAAGKQLGRLDMPLIHDVIGQLAHGIDFRAGLPWHDERSALTCEPMRWIYLLRPDWVALEQVPAVLPVWQDIAARLRKLGYSAWTGYVYAERYGVPQTRKRAVLLASKLREVGEPEATHQRYYPPKTKAAANPPDAHLPRWVSMAEALGWGMTERPYPAVACSSSTGGPDLEKVGGSGARRIIYDEQAEGRWSGTFRPFGRPNRGGTHQDGEWMPEEVHFQATNDRPSWALTEKTRSWQRWQMGDVRQSNGAVRDVDEPAPTMTASMGNGNFQWVGRSEGAVRVTIEEAGVLQSFDPAYPWQGTKTKRFQQVGNAIPPILARACLAEVIGYCNGGINYKALGVVNEPV